MSTSLQCVLRSDVARLYRTISKRLAVETTSLYCSCFITPSHHSCSLAWPDPRRKREGLATPDYRSCSSLLKSTHAISIDFAEMHADHIVSSGSPHNNVLHFSSNIIMRTLQSCSVLSTLCGVYEGCGLRGASRETQRDQNCNYLQSRPRTLKLFVM